MSASMQNPKTKASRIHPDVPKPMPKRVHRKPRPAPVISKSIGETQIERFLNADVARHSEKREQALELFKAGLGYTRVGRILNISVNTVRDWSREFKHGTFKVEPSDNQYRYTDEVRNNAIRLRLQGYSWTEIQKMTGIPSATVRKWVVTYTETPGRKKQVLVPVPGKAD